MAKTNGKLRMGMVGGGEGAFIGDMLWMASRLDGKLSWFMELCAAQTDFVSNRKLIDEGHVLLRLWASPKDATL